MTHPDTPLVTTPSPLTATWRRRSDTLTTTLIGAAAALDPDRYATDATLLAAHAAGHTTRSVPDIDQILADADRHLTAERATTAPAAHRRDALDCLDGLADDLRAALTTGLVAAPTDLDATRRLVTAVSLTERWHAALTAGAHHDDTTHPELPLNS